MISAINNNSSINFNGAFVIKSIPAQAKQELLELIPKNKHFFNNYKTEGNILLVTKPSKDVLVAKFIKNNHLGFKYYPTLNTKSGFDSYQPAAAEKILRVNSRNAVITQKDMFSILRKGENLPQRARKDSRTRTEHILKALQLDKSDVIIQKNKGYTAICNKEGKIIAKASPESRYGLNFIYVEPRNADETGKRFAIDENGEIVSKYISVNGILKFMKNFSEAVRFNKCNK